MTAITLPLAQASALLAGLYNGSRPLGMGIMHYRPEPMTEARAEKLLSDKNFPEETAYFDYVNGRVMKVELRADSEEGTVSFQPELYDRDIGQGAAQRIADNIQGS